MKMNYFHCFFLFIFVANGKGEDCVWNKATEFPQYPPLILDIKEWTSYLPVKENGDKVLKIAADATVLLVCPGTTISSLATVVTEASCVGGDKMDVNGEQFTMMDLGCQKRVKETLMKNLGDCGSKNEAQLQAVGYTIPGYHFYKLYDVCFEYTEQSLLFEHHTVRGAFYEGHDVNPSRPGFKSSSGFFTVSVSSCYEIASQRELLENILGDSNLIDVSHQLYFARGHMAPDADFFTEMEEDATYYYINAVPQWQAFNNGNWKYLEMSVRDLASAHGTDFKIWSGPWDVLQLDDTNGTPVDIFLGLAEEEAVIPAPLLTWKVIFEESSNKAIAVIGANNPFLTEFPKPICENICDQISWIDFDVNDLAHGATYCCTVEDLRAVIPHVPELPGVDILDA